MFTLECYVCGKEIKRIIDIKKAICFDCKMNKVRENTKRYRNNKKYESISGSKHNNFD